MAVEDNYHIERDETLADLKKYAEKNMDTAPPGYVTVSADVLWNVVYELQLYRKYDDPPRVVA